MEAQAELDNFDALVDVNCYELVPLFLCSLFVPKCSLIGKPVPPCKNLCSETMKRCGFFFDVFGLELPEYLTCKLFSDSENPEECVGGKEVKDLKNQKPVCDDFLCDQKRCLPKKWVCDGNFSQSISIQFLLKLIAFLMQDTLTVKIKAMKSIVKPVTHLKFTVGIPNV